MIKLIIFLTALFASAIGFMWGAILDGRYYDARSTKKKVSNS